MTKVQWTVGLSNGETIAENKSNFNTIEGELSPWQRLLLYLAKEGVTITSLSLFTDDGKRWNLPSAGKNPKFAALADIPKPISYKMFRKVGADIINKQTVNEELYTVAEATFENGSKLQVWVSEESLTSWSIMI